MRMAIRGRPRDKRWKHVLRINYGRNQWTARAPRRNSAQTGSFLLKMRECAHGEFVLQPFRNREEERDAGKKITILRILRSMETKRTKKNETCHRVNRFEERRTILKLNWYTVIHVERVIDTAKTTWLTSIRLINEM